jgi:hypothetical protein
MPKSRGRKPRRSSKQRPGRPRTAPSGWGELEPWARAMAMADEAEARGDANGALEVMEAFALGPDGKPFWRPWRVEYLCQIASLAAILPAWVTSRWICNQAMQCLHEGNRDRQRRAYDVAVELRGGRDQLPGVDEADAHGRVVDRDWVYRQLFLYELGGLDFFVRRIAASTLLAGAESIQDWAKTPMGGYRFEGSTPDVSTWLDLVTGQQHTTPNIGSALFVLPGEHVIGRLVPINGGELFETQPLLVPELVAGRVAERPAEWLEILRAARTEPGEVQIVTHGRHHHSLLSDVPSLVWQMGLVGDLPPCDGVDEGADLARFLLSAAAHELRAGLGQRPAGEVDVWPCLGAAILDPNVVRALPDAVRPRDRGSLVQLGELLAEPAATLCRGAAQELFDAA